MHLVFTKAFQSNLLLTLRADTFKLATLPGYFFFSPSSKIPLSSHLFTYIKYWSYMLYFTLGFKL